MSAIRIVVSTLTLSTTLTALLAVSCKSNNISSSNTTNNTIIGPAGGEIDGPGGMKVLVPRGAVPQSTTFSASTVTTYPDLKGAALVGPVYSLEPHGFVFSGTVTVSLPLEGATSAEVLHSNCGSNGTCQAWDTSVSGVSFVNGNAVFPASTFSLYTLVTAAADSGVVVDSGLVDAGLCVGTAPPPATAVRSVSLSLTGVDFAGATATSWQNIGFDLDGKCTTSASTDVCTQMTGSKPSEQADGLAGIDNSFGANICPVQAQTTGGCSSGISQTYLVTDGSGSGTLSLTYPGSGGGTFNFPVQDVYVALNGSGGVAGGVMPTAGVVATYQQLAGHISTSLCSGSGFASIEAEVEQASDIVSDGTNSAGVACNGISFGFTFTGSTAFTGSLPSSTNYCAMDASTDSHDAGVTPDGGFAPPPPDASSD